jgi:PAS domain S-box-containing protein
MARTRRPAKQTAARARSATKPSALLVEDSPTQAEAILATLEQGGFDATLAKSGDEAVKLLERKSFDLVVSDIVMPGAVDGYELCRRLKAGPHRETPVVLLTSLSDPMDIIRGLEVGADNFLTKPYEPAHLLKRLEVLLATRQARTGGRVRAGVVVYFMGKQFVITSEREQVLDLLVSTFEDAVRQNHELIEREDALARSRQTLAALYDMSVALNRCTTVSEVADKAVAHALKVPGVRAGWLVLQEGDAGFRLVASRNLPPALQAPGAMDGDCQCRRKLLAGELNEGTNVMECERLRGALGDTRGLRYHVTVPLWVPGRTVGLLNLVGREEGLFSDEDRTMLYGVGNQIAAALERARLTEHMEELVERRTAALRAEVAERERAEVALRSSEEQFRQLAENIKEAFFVGELATGRTLYASSTWASIWGRPAEDAYRVPWAWLEAIHPEDKPNVLAHQEALARGESDVSVFRIVRPDGSIRWVKGRAFPVRDPAGTIYRLAGLAEDVTEEHRAAEELRVSEERYRGLVDGSIQGIVVRRGDEVIFVNRPLARLLGYESPDELTGKRIWEFIAPGEHERVKEYTRLRIRGEPAPPRYELEMVRRDGSAVWVDVFVSIVNWDGEPAVLSTLVDITERRKLEEQYRQAQKMEAVGQLAGGVAHDFNNLLTAICGYTDLVREDLPPDDPRRSDLDEVRNAADRAAALTRQLLAFSRRQVMQPVVLDINEVVVGMEKMLHRLIGEDVELDARLAPDLAGVHADPGQLEQVIMNLAVNARDAMPKGGKLTMETSLVELDKSYTESRELLQPGRYVLLAVTDSGTGMDEQTKARIFEPFFTTKEPGKGTGLGLATVYGIMKQSGGHVSAYSEVGHGTTFKVYLPAAATKAEAPTRMRPTEVVRGGTETVLLVEDEPGVRKLAQEVLARNGYAVLNAENGAEALRVCQTSARPIHLMVTDVVMPKMGGPESADQLKAIRPEMKVLFMSGYADRAIASHQVLSAGTPFLQKPFTPAALARKVREVLDG